jgi:hypothetical protein
LDTDLKDNGSCLSLIAYLRLTGMEKKILFQKNFFLEKKPRKSKVVKINLISIYKDVNPIKS